MLVAGDDQRIQRVPERFQLVGLCRVGPTAGTDADILNSRGARCQFGPLVRALVEAGPGEQLVGARIEIHPDVVRLQLVALDVLTAKIGTLVVADKQGGFRHFMLEGVGVFHIIIVHEAQAILAKGQRVVVNIIARGQTQQGQRADRSGDVFKISLHIGIK